MANILRLIGWLLLWFLVAPCVFAQSSGLNCSFTTSTRTAFDICQNWPTQCRSQPTAYECGLGTCKVNGTVVPSCWRHRLGPNDWSHLGYTGVCTSSAQGEGPRFEFTGAGAPPADVCFGPCRADTSHCSCVGLQNGEQNCICNTTQNGELCVAGNAGNPEPPEDNNCDESIQIRGKCLEVEPSDSNGGGDQDEDVCFGDACVRLPPPAPEGTCGVGTGAAICIGLPGGDPPRPPSPPYPPNQPPVISTNASSTNPASGGPGNGGAAYPVEAYGPPGTSTTDPDEEGNCPTGTTPLGDVCVCPIGTMWTGAACAEGEEEGTGRTASAGTCAAPPQCGGDAIDCSVVYQTWVTRCALESSSAAPDVNLGSNPLEGVDLFGEADQIGPGSLNDGGFLSGGGCPMIDPIPVLGMTLVIPAVWCEVSWLGTLLVMVAYLVALRIVYGE